MNVSWSRGEEAPPCERKLEPGGTCAVARGLHFTTFAGDHLTFLILFALLDFTYHFHHFRMGPTHISENEKRALETSCFISSI